MCGQLGMPYDRPRHSRVWDTVVPYLTGMRAELDPEPCAPTYPQRQMGGPSEPVQGASPQSQVHCSPDISKPCVAGLYRWFSDVPGAQGPRDQRVCL